MYRSQTKRSKRYNGESVANVDFRAYFGAIFFAPTLESMNIKKLTKIPPDFPLAKYDAVADFKCEDWFVNLEFRYRFFFSLKKLKAVEQWSDSARLKSINIMECNKHLKSIVEQILSNPIIPYHDDAPITLYNGNEHLPYQTCDKNVQTLLNSDLYWSLLHVD